MEKRELQRKITATCVITAIFCVMLGISVYLLLMSELFTPTIQWLMIACCGILAVSVVGFVWNKVLEIRALRIVIRDNISTQSNNSLATSTNSVEPIHNTIVSLNSLDTEQNDFFSEHDLYEENAEVDNFELLNNNSLFETENNAAITENQAEKTNEFNLNDNNFIDAQISYSDFQKADESNVVVNSPVASYDEDKLLQKSVEHDDLINQSIYKAQSVNDDIQLNNFATNVQEEWAPSDNEQFVQAQSAAVVAQENIPAPQPIVQPIKQPQAPVQPAPIQSTAPSAPVQPVPAQNIAPSAPVQPAPMQSATPIAPVQPAPIQSTAPIAPVQPVPMQSATPSAPVQQKPVQNVAPTTTAPVRQAPVPNQKRAPAPIDWAEIKRQNENNEKDRLNKIAIEKAKANEAAFKLAAEREKQAIELAQREKEKRNLMLKQQEQLNVKNKIAQDKISQEQYEKMRKEEHEKAQLRHRQEQERLAKEHAMKQEAEKQAKIAFEKAQSAQDAAKRSDEIAKRLGILAGLSDDGE